MTRCPKCREDTLTPLTGLAPDLGSTVVPHQCSRCGGFWLRREAISQLRDTRALQGLDALEGKNELATEGDRKNGLCPSGHGLLSRAKVTWRRPFYLERCSTCFGIWLDAGEWSRLGSEELFEQLDEFWTPSWRKELREEEVNVRYQEDLRRRLGEPLIERIEDLGKTLAEHPDRSLAVAYLRATIREHAANRPPTDDAE